MSDANVDDGDGDAGNTRKYVFVPRMCGAFASFRHSSASNGSERACRPPSESRAPTFLLQTVPPAGLDCASARALIAMPQRNTKGIKYKFPPRNIYIIYLLGRDGLGEELHRMAYGVEKSVRWPQNGGGGLGIIRMRIRMLPGVESSPSRVS